MIEIIEEKKVYYPETIDEEPLPQTVVWESISNRPRNIGELDPNFQADFDAVIAEIEAGFLDLGDLAFLDLITSTQITDNAITSPKIAAGAIVAGKIAAGAIDGITITGSLIRTSASGARVEIRDSTDRISVFDSGGEERMRLDEDELTFYDAAGDITGTIGALYSNILAINLPAGELGLVVYYDAVAKMAVSNNGSVFYDDILASGTVDIGSSSQPFEDLFIDDIRLTAQSSNPTSNGMMRYYLSGGNEGLRMQFGGSDFQFDASGV